MLNMAPGELCEKGEMVALNVGSKDAIDVITLADQVCKAMKLDSVEYSFTGGVDGGRGWKGDVKFMRLDIKALMKHGWTLNIPVEEPLRKQQLGFTKTLNNLEKPCSVVRPIISASSRAPGFKSRRSTKFYFRIGS